MKLLYHGPLYKGATALQRAEAFQRNPDILTEVLDTGAAPWVRPSLYHRIRNKLQFPVDRFDENRRIIERVRQVRPDVVIVDNSRQMNLGTLKALRNLGVRKLVFYTPDDILSRYNITFQLRRNFPEWDLVITTKTFHLEEMKAFGVRRVFLAGNAYDPAVHHSLTPEEVGPQYESFDAVFIGAHEAERRNSINALAESGVSVVVYGANGGWAGQSLHPGVTLRPSQFAAEYTRCIHHGKIALGFLRKISRDLITQRSIEIAGMARPMLAEKTSEHDAHLVDGEEYVGFTDDRDLVDKARMLLSDDARRRAVGAAAYRRCLSSGYSVYDRGVQMLEAIEALPERDAPAGRPS